ncbi:MAG TPA: hypothetical protein DCK93_01125 [Blastocatellia bacterium]|jgi:uncharacterized protein (DUF4415 family)|nr:hypothetical protein [Blastocatellia bacterium]
MKRTLLTVGLMLLVLIVAFFVIRKAEAKMEVMEIPPVPQEIVADVVTYDLDPARVTCDWPKTVTVTNISDKQISKFQVDIWSPDGEPLRSLFWGTNSNSIKQPQLLNPGEKVTLPIDEKIVQTFKESGKTFLYVQVDFIWMNNDPSHFYSDGSIFQQDSSNPGHYTLIRDAKGRVRLPSGKLVYEGLHHNHVLTPHITHSVKPPFLVG